MMGLVQITFSPKVVRILPLWKPPLGWVVELWMYDSTHQGSNILKGRTRVCVRGGRCACVSSL